VQVRTGHSTSSANLADGLPGFHLVPSLHGECRQVAVDRDESLAVIDDHIVAVEEVIADIDDHAVRRRPDRCAGGGGNVHARMRIA